MKPRFQVNTRLDGSGARLVDPETGEELSTCTFAMTIEHDRESEPRRSRRMTVELDCDPAFLPLLIEKTEGRLPLPLDLGTRRSCPACDQQWDGSANYCGNCGCRLRPFCSYCLQRLPTVLPDQTKTDKP